MPNIVTVALENRPILDGTGSALRCKTVFDRSVWDSVEIHWCNEDPTGVID